MIETSIALLIFAMLRWPTEIFMSVLAGLTGAAFYVIVIAVAEIGREVRREFHTRQGAFL
jgi:hypothetical protein